MSKQADESGQTNRPGRLITALAVLLFSLLLVASLALGYLGGGSYGDPSGGPADRLWSVLAMAVAGLLFLANILALRFLMRREPTIGTAAAVLFGVTLAGLVALIPAGLAMLTELENSGHDYTGLGAVGCLVFGIALPGLIGLVTLGGGACLLVMRRQINRCPQEQR